MTGQKFSARNLEVALPLTIQFDGKGDPTDDPFLVGPNAYVTVVYLFGVTGRFDLKSFPIRLVEQASIPIH